MKDRNKSFEVCDASGETCNLLRGVVTLSVCFHASMVGQLGLQQMVLRK